MDPAQAKELEMHAGERAINAAINLGDSEVQRFYKGTTILITGGTGFIGKQLTEKLFRSCDVKKAFLLMRPRKGKTIQARLEKLLEDPVFDSVKKMRPGFEKKLCPVFGDVSDLGLGIQNEDYVDIINETDIIIHGAASINFEEPFKAAVNTNVRGTVEMLNLGKQCKKLKSFVYVSTAFTHAVESRIKTAVHEEFYEPGLTPQVAIEMAATIEEKLLNEITPKLTQNWRNVYIFTKAIAEEAVRQAKDLPICIVRPAVVIASYQEPAPGWMDMSSALGVSGFIMGVGFGLLHSMHIDLKVQLNLVPVDLVNNAIIVAGWTTATRHERGEVPKIYTVNNNRNPVTWRMAWENFDAMKERYCSPLQNYYNFSHNTSHRMIYVFLNWLWHYIPGYILDFVFLVMGKKPMAVKLYTRAHKVTSVFSFFMTNDWLFTDENLVAMFNSLNQTDRKIYNCDMASVNTFDMYTAWILVIASYQEPAPGWMDMSSALGVSGFIMGVGFGLLHSMHIDLEVQLNLVPVDLVNNAIIVAGWTTATRHERGEVPKIYTVNNNRNPVTWRMAWENFDAMKERYCSPLQNYYNFSHNTSHRMIYVFLNWLWHYIPGYILDFVFLVMGKKPMAVKLYTRAHKVTSVFSFFMTNDWLFTDKNLVAMFNSLNQTDRKIYNCDMASVNTFDMYTAWILGVRKYIKKDGLQGTEYGLKKQFWFGILHYTVVLPIYFSLLFMVAMLVFTVFSYCWALGSSVISWILGK